MKAPASSVKPSLSHIDDWLSGRLGAAIAGPNDQRRPRFSGILAANGLVNYIIVTSISYALEAKRCRHRAVAIEVIAVAGVISTRSGK
jgi:hypothetical protein